MSRVKRNPLKMDINSHYQAKFLSSPFQSDPNNPSSSINRIRHQNHQKKRNPLQTNSKNQNSQYRPKSLHQKNRKKNIDQNPILYGPSDPLDFGKMKNSISKIRDHYSTYTERIDYRGGGLMTRSGSQKNKMRFNQKNRGLDLGVENVRVRPKLVGRKYGKIGKKNGITLTNVNKVQFSHMNKFEMLKKQLEIEKQIEIEKRLMERKLKKKMDVPGRPGGQGKDVYGKYVQNEYRKVRRKKNMSLTRAGDVRFLTQNHTDVVNSISINHNGPTSTKKKPFLVERNLGDWQIPQVMSILEENGHHHQQQPLSNRENYSSVPIKPHTNTAQTPKGQGTRKELFRQYNPKNEPSTPQKTISTIQKERFSTPPPLISKQATKGPDEPILDDFDDDDNFELRALDRPKPRPRTRPVSVKNRPGSPSNPEKRQNGWDNKKIKAQRKNGNLNQIFQKNYFDIKQPPSMKNNKFDNQKRNQIFGSTGRKNRPKSQPPQISNSKAQKNYNFSKEKNAHKIEKVEMTPEVTRRPITGILRSKGQSSRPQSRKNMTRRGVKFNSVAETSDMKKVKLKDEKDQKKPQKRKNK